MNVGKKFDKFSGRAIVLVGSHWGFGSAIVVVGMWAIAGPFFGWSQAHSLFINTLTTIVSFFLLFVIQQSINKDTNAIHLKLNELIASNVNASNRLINVEDLDEEELEMLKMYHEELRKSANKIRGKKEQVCMKN